MIDIIALEKRWYRYKIKSLLPIIGGTISIVFVLSISIYFSSTQNSVPLKKAIITTPQNKEIIVKKEIVIQPKKKIVSEKQTLLTPSMSFLTTIKKEPIIEQHLTPKKVKISPKYVNIIRNNSTQDIKDVLERFNNTNNPALSLFIAKKYYEMGEFKKAYNYALKTNEIDSNIDASWILFTKSLVKLQKKEMALEILQRYIKHSHSQQAQQLSSEIKNGVFK